MHYGLVACPTCRKARVIERGRKTAQCGHCARRLKLDTLRVWAWVETPEEARVAAGALNARLAGKESEFKEDVLAAMRDPDAVSDDPIARAAARVRATPGGESARVDAAARALTDALGEWSVTELAAALERAGLARVDADAALAKLQARSVIVEPRLGRYRAV